MTTRLHDAPAAPGAPVPSALPNLRGIPLDRLPAAAKATLSETLNRVLPTPEIQAVPVAAFNSSI